MITNSYYTRHPHVKRLVAPSPAPPMRAIAMASAHRFDRTGDMSRTLHHRQAWIFRKLGIDDRALASVKHGPARRLDALRKQAVGAQSDTSRLIVRTFRIVHLDTILLEALPVSLKRYSGSRPACLHSLGGCSHQTLQLFGK